MGATDFTPSTSTDADHHAELNLALRAWWPMSEDRRKFADEVQTRLDEAFAGFRRQVPHSGLKKIEDVWTPLAHALTQGYLGVRTRKQTSCSIAEYVEDIPPDPLAEMVLLAACQLRDDAANAALVDHIERNVRPAITRKWGSGTGERVVDDLPSMLFETSSRGFNRGMARLLSFAGQSKLATWLRTIATNRAIDAGPSDEIELSTLDRGGSSFDPADTRDGKSDESRELGRRLSDSLPTVVRELHGLLQSSPQQLQYFALRCEGETDTARICELLDVTKSRVVELSQQVTRKFLDVLSRHDPAFAGTIAKGSSVSPETRQAVEAILVQFFEGDSRTEDAEGAEMQEMSHDALR